MALGKKIARNTESRNAMFETLFPRRCGLCMCCSHFSGSSESEWTEHLEGMWVCFKTGWKDFGGVAVLSSWVRSSLLHQPLHNIFTTTAPNGRRCKYKHMFWTFKRPQTFIGHSLAAQRSIRLSWCRECHLPRNRWSLHQLTCGSHRRLSPASPWLHRWVQTVSAASTSAAGLR